MPGGMHLIRICKYTKKQRPVKRYFFYNIMLNVALILMILSVVAAYNSNQLPILVISVLIIALLIFLKYRLLKLIKQQTKK